MTPKYFLRDVIFLMIANVYLLCLFLFAHKIELWSSLCLLGIYAVYVIIVVVQSKKREVELDGEQLAANLFQELIQSEKQRI